MKLVNGVMLLGAIRVSQKGTATIRRWVGGPDGGFVNLGHFASKEEAESFRIEYSKIEYEKDRLARFWSHVNKDGPVLNAKLEQCWVWLRATNKRGYGIVRYDGNNELAHRRSWLLATGNLPADMDICHHCDNPPCVRPSHLFIGTDADNVADCVSKLRHTFGMRNGCAVHPVEVVEEIRAKFASGMRVFEIAKLLGLRSGYVQKITSGNRRSLG